MGQATTARLVTRSALSKEYRPLLDAAKAAGWTVYLTSKNHVIWQPPDGGDRLTTGLTMKSRTGVKATYAKFRRAGLPV